MDKGVYSQVKLKPYKIFLLVSFCLLSITLVILVTNEYLLNKKISEGTQGVYITDVNDRSAVVSWITSDPVKTELIYSKKDITFASQLISSKIVYDIRDQEEVGELEYVLQKRENYYVHYVLLRNLEPETQYFFAIKNGLFLNRIKYINSFTTTKQREVVETPDIAYGNIMNQDGNLISDTLLIFQLTNLDDTNKSQQISYITDEETGWTANFSNLWNSTLEEEYIKDQDTYIEIHIINSKEDSSRVLEFKDVKPLENIVVYDNDFQKDEGKTSVKGIMAVLIPGITPIDDEDCVCKSCIPNCPSDYFLTSCPSGWNCDKKTISCTKFYRCDDGESGPCGIVNKTCYKKLSEKVPETSCKDCVPVCPDGYSFTRCESGQTCEQTPSKCTKRDSDGVICGTKRGALCYKQLGGGGQGDKKTKEECVYSPEEKRMYYWCNCPGGGTSACLSAINLLNNFNSSCSNYCQKSANNDFIKTRFCGEGALLNCSYGCETRGSQENDICKVESGNIPQEVTCAKYTTEGTCEGIDSSCIWESSKCVPKNQSGDSCSSLDKITLCNERSYCEFVVGVCQEIDLEDYKKPLAGEGVQEAYCTGLKDSKGQYIGINYGTNAIDTHINRSRCSIDVGASNVDLGNQIPGSNLNSDKKRTWSVGYTCKVGEYDEDGYGNHIIVTTPTGEKIIYAHLSSANCNGIIKTGNTGNTSGAHLHLEVRDSNGGIPENCSENLNPCKYTPGGCFSCTAVRHAAIPLEHNGETAFIKEGINIKKNLFSLISEVYAKEEYLNPSDLIKDLDLEEGTYNIIVASTSKKTDYIKTDSTHIVFFEDDNNNGTLDDGETVLSPYESQVEYNISYKRTTDAFELILEEGLNLVSFPIILKDGSGTEVKKASELIAYLNTKDTDITLIASYRGGKFITYVLREGKGFGEDFNILPGEGYFIIAHSRGVFSYSGQKVKDGLEVKLYEGWNLINIYNSKKKIYQGFDVLKQMKEQSIGADALSKWENGSYTSIVDSEGNKFGNDFNVYQNRGYFVRVRENSGLYTPK